MSTPTGQRKSPDRWIIICLRQGAAIPIVDEDDEMAIMTYDEAIEATEESMLCRASENLLIDIETGDSEWH